MSDEPKKPPTAWLWWAFLMAILLYPLWLGPVFFICGFFSLGEPAVIGVVYAPLLPFAHALRPYHQAWHDCGALVRRSMSR
jgi:hypothetical protein